MGSVLFQEAPAVVDDLIAERRRRGVDLLRPAAEALGLVVRWEVGIGRHDDHRIPDVVVADPAHLDDVGHYLLTAAIAVEVVSPNGRIDKRPFYLAHGVDEVVVVDPCPGTVEWYAIGRDGTRYEPVDTSTVVALGPADLVELLTA